MQKLQKLVLPLLVVLMMLTGTAMAQQRVNVGQLVSGLINVNVGAIVVDVELDNVLNNLTVVEIGDINISDNDVRILNNVLNNNTILSNNSEILTNLLRDADIIDDVQVVVGVLSGGFLVVQ